MKERRTEKRVNKTKTIRKTKINPNKRLQQSVPRTILLPCHTDLLGVGGGGYVWVGVWVGVSVHENRTNLQSDCDEDGGCHAHESRGPVLY